MELGGDPSGWEGKGRGGTMYTMTRLVDTDSCVLLSYG